MTDVIQRNAVNILAISLQFFTRIGMAQAITPAKPISLPINETSAFMQTNVSKVSTLLLT